MTAVYAITDFRRGATPARGRARRNESAPPAGPPPLVAPPREWVFFAVPGSASCAIAGEAVTIEALPENLAPGTVAQRVTCVLCEAYWPGTRLPDGRPVLAGGIALMRWYRQEGGWRWIAKRCRCDAGQRLPLEDLTPLEWRWFVTRQLLRVRKALENLPDTIIEQFLIDPRGPVFSECWHYHLRRARERGWSPKKAHRAAYMRAYKERA